MLYFARKKEGKRKIIPSPQAPFMDVSIQRCARDMKIILGTAQTLQVVESGITLPAGAASHHAMQCFAALCTAERNDGALILSFAPCPTWLKFREAVPHLCETLAPFPPKPDELLTIVIPIRHSCDCVNVVLCGFLVG